MRLALVIVSALLAPELLAAPADIVHTRHNLSVSGPGPIRSLTETRICVFCHVPHDASPRSPLWNRALEPQVYSVYTSPSLRADPLPQPFGPTKLCLSCHDGTIAVGAVLDPAQGIAMAAELTPESPAYFGLDLSGHHPVSFSYSSSLPDPQLANPPPPDLVWGGADELHCSTCHDPHDDTYGSFLAKDNSSSGLCTTCHRMSGWATSAHASTSKPVSVSLAVARVPSARPSERGCQVCHTAHAAPTAGGLPDARAAGPEAACTSSCHGSGSLAATSALGAGGLRAGADIARQVRKPSAHRQSPLWAATRAEARSGLGRVRDVGCSDCHEPHSVRAARAEPPFASGLLLGTSGVDRHGTPVPSVTYEYEVCFKCHGDDAPGPASIRRVIPTSSLRRAFDPASASYHPVVAMARSLDVPSLPSPLEPAMTPSSSIYCTSCHADDEGGARGPHGSAYAPILARRYDTADGTPESHESYALCYGCHDRSSILADDSFRRSRASVGGGHSGHLASGAPCAACHDPHGVPAPSPGRTGSHTHLVNFDTRIVLPRPGAAHPLFHDGGTYAGRCDLVCHGVEHAGASYP